MRGRVTVGRWDEMAKAYNAAPEGTAVVLWRAFENAPWQQIKKPAWGVDDEYRLLLNFTEWQPRAPMFQERVEIPPPLTTLEGRAEAWLVTPTGAAQVILGDWRACRGDSLETLERRLTAGECVMSSRRGRALMHEQRESDA